MPFQRFRGVRRVSAIRVAWPSVGRYRSQMSRDQRPPGATAPQISLRISRHRYWSPRPRRTRPAAERGTVSKSLQTISASGLSSRSASASISLSRKVTAWPVQEVAAVASAAAGGSRCAARRHLRREALTHRDGVRTVDFAFSVICGRSCGSVSNRHVTGKLRQV